MKSTLPDPTELYFPYNVMFVLEDALQELAPHTSDTQRDGLRIYQRRLRQGDESESIGIFPTNWEPDDESAEMRGRSGAVVDTFQRYPIQVQSWIQDTDEFRGITHHAYLAALVRETLVHSPILAIDLPTLAVGVRGGVMEERTAKWGLLGQDLLSADLGSNQFGFLAVTRFYVDTQINQKG